MIDYTVFYKKKYTDIKDLGNKKWDLYVSAYNNSHRVQIVYDSVFATNKHWLLMPDYKYSSSDYPKGVCYDGNAATDESIYFVKYFDKYYSLYENASICVDITGFMRPYLVFMFRYLYEIGITNIDVIYSDPVKYGKEENTEFTRDFVYDVRQIAGCEGVHDTVNNNDLLIIGSGYDHKLISSVSEAKSKAKKIQIFGFPSLQPDMFQENILRAYNAEESLGGEFLQKGSFYYAPANDPFVTADVLRQIYHNERLMGGVSNLYLSPLSTKAQTLGFIIYYLWECLDKSISIIFPFCQEYTRETTIGLSKVWMYNVELPKRVRD